MLEACFNGDHRMLAAERGIAVMRVQAALVELGQDVGPAGTDGIFGERTGDAVVAFKTRKNLQPNDPVVGPGTSKALDDDLFVDPPELDPAFAEFAPAVVAHRVEPFIGRELAQLMAAPLDSWRHMVARFAADRLDSGELLGVVAMTRTSDLRGRYDDVAAPMQLDGLSAAQHFDQQAGPDGAQGRTVEVLGTDGGLRSFVWVNDEVVMGRGSVLRTTTGLRAPATLLGVLMHELNHVRNLGADDLSLAQTPDTDPVTYVDPALAQASSAAGTPTVEVLRSFVREICARHVHWIAEREAAGEAFAARFLDPAKLVEASRFYLQETDIFHLNGYVPTLVARGLSTTYAQIGRWLRICSTLAFSDSEPENTRTRSLFNDAAQLAEALSADPPLDFPVADGLFPLPEDFVL